MGSVKLLTRLLFGGSHIVQTAFFGLGSGCLFASSCLAVQIAFQGPRQTSANSSDWIGQQAVTVTAIALEIIHNGKKVGVTKIPSGRNVRILEAKDGRVKVSAAPMTYGWIDASAIKIVDGSKEENHEAGAADKSARPSGIASAEKSTNSAAPLPPNRKSKIAVTEIDNPETFGSADPDDCRGITHKLSFEPEVILGPDTRGKDVVLRFYLVVLKEKKEEAKSASKTLRVRTTDGSYVYDEKKNYEPAVRRYDDVPINPGEDSLAPILHKYTEYTCRSSYCRQLKDDKYIGWYAELVDGSKVICKERSSMSPQANEALDDFLKMAVR